MSKLQVDNIVNKADNGAPTLSRGAIVTGVITATTFKGTSGEFTGNVSIGGTITYEDVNNVDPVGIITARGGIRIGTGGTVGPVGSGIVTYFGDGSNLTGVVSGIEVKSSGSSVGTSLTALNFTGVTVSTGSAGITTVTVAAAGIATNSYSGGLVTLDLSKDEHKVTATGITTLTVTGGTEGDTHIVRVINSGITTVGFSTYFLFPSGSTPSLPTASGAFSQISFQVNRVGAAGTQLFATAALNFS